FQPLFLKVLELCENGNKEIAYDMLWSGKGYSEEEAAAAKKSKEMYG
ncbi:MAG: ligand-binding protein SH3, partial [Candidatus Marinimicrobia bacterium]|nr:ligand-binding protein SH3 [Candidatus Neomarinimicrobiota bacterium]